MKTVLLKLQILKNQIVWILLLVRKFWNNHDRVWRPRQANSTWPDRGYNKNGLGLNPKPVIGLFRNYATIMKCTMINYNSRISIMTEQHHWKCPTKSNSYNGFDICCLETDICHEEMDLPTQEQNLSMTYNTHPASIRYNSNNKRYKINIWKCFLALVKNKSVRPPRMTSIIVEHISNMTLKNMWTL